MIWHAEHLHIGCALARGEGKHLRISLAVGVKQSTRTRRGAFVGQHKNRRVQEHAAYIQASLPAASSTHT